MAYLQSNEPYDRVGHPVAGALTGLGVAGAARYLTSGFGSDQMSALNGSIAQSMLDKNKAAMNKASEGLIGGLSSETKGKYANRDLRIQATRDGIDSGLNKMRKAGKWAYRGGWKGVIPYAAAALAGGVIGSMDKN